MSSTTKNLGLFKYDTETDAKQVFDLNVALNNNWDILDEKASAGGLEICDIGIAPCGIDETKNKRRYLNGQVIMQDQFSTFATKLKQRIGWNSETKTASLLPNLVKTETEWQAIKTSSDFAQVGAFVIDDVAGTIRLPAVINIQGLFDLQNGGLTISSGLPNIVGGFSASVRTNNWFTSGSFFANTNSISDMDVTVSGSYQKGYTGFDASRSNAIYGNSSTVQVESIQYPFFIQVATGAIEIVEFENKYQLNNPYSLLDIKWSDKVLNNSSWLRSTGQPNSAAVYPSVYNLLLSEYNQGSEETDVIENINITYRIGKSTGIKITTDKTAYDNILQSKGTAWYYVIDTSNELFYLPQTNGFMQFGGNGQFIEAGLPNITGSFQYYIQCGSYSGAFQRSSTGNHTGGPNGSGANMFNFDASLSNPIYSKDVDTVQPNAIKGYLYFYVGDTLENTQLINVARIEEKLVDELSGMRTDIESMRYLIESYKNGNNWYRKYSDGWIEQGGINAISSGTTTITLPLSYTDTTFGILGTIRVSGDPNNGNQTVMIAPINTSQIRGYLDWVNNSATLNCTWYCYGY